MREVIIASNLDIFEMCSWFKFNNLLLKLDMVLKFDRSVSKWLKVKSDSFEANFNVSRSYRGKTGRRPFLPPSPLSILNRVRPPVPRSGVSNYSDAYIVVKGTIDLLADAAREVDKAQKNIRFKDNARFRSCISKINNILIENAEDLDVDMRMCNLLEYSDNYFMKSGSLWNYYRDKIDAFDNNASQGISFECQTKINGETPERLLKSGNERDMDQPPQPPEPSLNFEVTIPLKYLTNFWRYLDFPFVNCEVELDLLWTKDCVLVQYHNNITAVNLIITSTGFYVLVVT